MPLEVILVDKESVPASAGKLLREDWAVAGIYVLLGPPRDEAAPTLIRARPGSGGDILDRLRDHPRDNAWFTRALVARDTRVNWNTAEVGYLEGRLHELCRVCPKVDHDFRMDHDHTLGEYLERLMERQYLYGIIAALRLAGVPLDPVWA
jgi:hypothetical protein